MSLIGDFLGAIPGVSHVRDFTKKTLQNTSNKRALKGKTGVLGFFVPPTVPVIGGNGAYVDINTPGFRADLWDPPAIVLSAEDKKISMARKESRFNGSGGEFDAAGNLKPEFQLKGTYGTSSASAVIPRIVNKIKEVVSTPIAMILAIGAALVGGVYYFFFRKK